MVRDSISYVEDSFETECVDALLRVKTFLITRKKVPRSVRKALRDSCKKHLTDDLAMKTKEEIFADLMNNRIQKPLSLKLKKIYPLSLCEVRELRIEKEIFGRSKPIIEKKEELQFGAPAIGEGLDQMAEVESAKEPVLDQMAEVEQELAIKAKSKVETIAEDSTEKSEAKEEKVQKPKAKRATKKKEE